MRAASMQGLHPKDVSVMGFDGIALGKYLNPTLSSVSQPIEEIGIQAAKLLLSLLEGETFPLNLAGTYNSRGRKRWASRTQLRSVSPRKKRNNFVDRKTFTPYH